MQLRTDWACDYEEDMSATFKANNLHAHVRGLQSSVVKSVGRMD